MPRAAEELRYSRFVVSGRAGRLILSGAFLALLLAAPASARAADGGAPTDGGTDGPAAQLPPIVGPENAASALAYGPMSLDDNPSAACGTDRCLVAWNGVQGAWAMMVDASGKPLRAAAVLFSGTAGQQAVAYTGTTFVMATSSGGDVTLVEIGADGTPGTSVTLALGTSIFDSALAWNGSRLMLLYRDIDASTGIDVLSSVPLAADLTAAGPSVMLASETAVTSALGVVAVGSAFVVMASQQLWSLGSDGRPTVGPVASPAGSTTSNLALVAAGSVPMVLGSGSLYALGANLKTTASASVGVSAGPYRTGIGWNGSELLLASGTPDEFATAVAFARCTTGLALLDNPDKLAPILGQVYPLVVGVGGKFLIIAWKAYEGYTAGIYGVTTFPIGADGSLGATAETLISLQALEQRGPLLVAQPAGFVAGVEQGLFEMGVLPLGPDGKPVAGNAAADVVTYGLPLPDAIGVGPNGGVLVSGSIDDPRIVNVRFDGSGHTLDTTPHEVDASLTAMRGSATWNGSQFFWLFGSEITPIGTDGTFGTPFGYGGPYAEVSRADVLGTTTVVAWLDEVAGSPANTVQLRTIPLDATGSPLATTPANVGAQFPQVDPIPFTDHGLAIAHDPAGFLVAWDQVTTETSGALTSELRVARLGTTGKPVQSGTTLLRRETGAVPAGSAAAVVALSSPMVAFDGSVYWVTWREDGVQLRRVGTDGTALDAQPFKLIDEPFGDYAIASRGDGKIVIVYDRFDSSPTVESDRLQSRLVTTTPQSGTGAGGAGGVGAGGAGGKTTGAGGAGGVGAGGAGGKATGAGGAGGGAGGNPAGAGGTGVGGTGVGGAGGKPAGAAGAGGGVIGTGGGSGGPGGGGGRSATGGVGAAGGEAGSLGTGANGGTSSGCSCGLADGTPHSSAALALAAALALGAVVRRRRRNS